MPASFMQPMSHVDITDWQAFYSKVEDEGQIPSGSHAEIAAGSAIFRAMWLDLGAVKHKISENGAGTPKHVVLHADVLHIPDELVWRLDASSLTIYARRIHAARSARFFLDFRDSASAKLAVFCDDIAGALQVHAVTKARPQAPVSFRLDTAFCHPGALVSLAGDEAKVSALQRAHGMPLSLGSQHALALTNSFIFASLLGDSHPAVALDILKWVTGWSSQAPELEWLCGRSASLHALLSAQLEAARKSSVFVPSLSEDIYKEQARDFCAVASRYEVDYKRLGSQSALSAQGVKMAQALLDNAFYKSRYAGKLLEQAQANLENAIAAATQAEKNFHQQQLLATNTGIEFEQIGLAVYRREQIFQLIVSVASAIVSFGTALGSIAMGNSSTAPQAAEGATKVVEAAAKTGDAAASLAASMAKLKKLAQGMKALFELSMSILSSGNEAWTAQKFAGSVQAFSQQFSQTKASTGDEWDIFAFAAGAELQKAVDKEIRYAGEYRKELNSLAVYGKSLHAARLAVLQAAQQVVTMQLQQAYATQEQQRLQQLVASLGADQLAAQDLMQQLYLRYLDAKSMMLTALKSYQAAYFYWALSESGVRPSLVDPVGEIDAGLAQLAGITMDKTAALAGFKSQPQQMQDKRVVLDDPQWLAQLRQGSLTFTIPLDSDTFVGLDRVRLHTIRVWLEGARLPPDRSVSIRISSSGQHADRHLGKIYHFTSKPLARRFQYRVTAATGAAGGGHWVFQSGEQGTIEMDGSIDNDVRYAYFQPSPFSEWTISLPPELNPGLDLASVSRVSLQFSGSAIAS